MAKLRGDSSNVRETNVHLGTSEFVEDLIRMRCLQEISGEEIVREYGSEIQSKFVPLGYPSSSPVMICARNEEEDLPRTLFSLARGTYPVTPIVINNASTDRTTEFAQDLGALVIEEPVPGLINAMLKGYATFKTWGWQEPILITDADVYVVRTWAEEMNKFAYQNLLEGNGGEAFGRNVLSGRNLTLKDVFRTIISLYLDRKYYNAGLARAHGSNATIFPVLIQIWLKI